MPSHNFTINTTKWYNIQEDMKICQNFEKKEIKNEIHIILVAISMITFKGKHFNDINEVDNIKLQIKYKVEKLKLFQRLSLWEILDESL